MVLTKDWEVTESIIGVPGRVLAVRAKNRLFGDQMNFVTVYGKSGGSDSGAWLNGLETVLCDDHTNVIIGDFNFVTEAKDRKGNADGLNSYDVSLTTKYTNTVGGWNLRDAFRETEGDVDGFTYRHDCGWESRIDRLIVDEEFVGKIITFCHFLLAFHRLKNLTPLFKLGVQCN